MHHSSQRTKARDGPLDAIRSEIVPFRVIVDMRIHLGVWIPRNFWSSLPFGSYRPKRKRLSTFEQKKIYERYHARNHLNRHGVRKSNGDEYYDLPCPIAVEIIPAWSLI
jgi:hypothetical protein